MSESFTPVPPAAQRQGSRPTVVLADRSRLMLAGIAAILADAVELVAATHSYDGLRAVVDRHEPEVALVEFSLLYEADAGAFGALRDLATKLAVVVTADEMFPADLLRVFRAHARGVVVKDERPEKLLEAIAVARDDGQRYIDPRLAKDVLDLTRKGERGQGPFGLTVQELRIVRLVAEDRTNPEIARRLGISAETVKSHVRNALDKLGAYDRIHAARIVATHDLVGPTDATTMG